MPIDLLNPKPKQSNSDKVYRGIIYFLRAFAIAYVVILAFMMYNETSFVFPGAGVEKGDWKHTGAILEEVDFSSADGTKVYGYFFPHVKPKGTLLFCHGNAENIAVLVKEMQLLRDRYSLSVLVFDYRGYGKTIGPPSERKVVADSVAAIEWLTERTGLQPDEMFFMGRSLGGGVAVQLAAKYNPLGLILDRTFSSTVDVGANRYWFLPVRMVMRNQFPSASWIRQYDGPLFQMHGDRDSVIPVWSAERLFERSPSIDKQLLMVKGLDHMDPWPEQFLDALDKWFNGFDGWNELEVDEMEDSESMDAVLKE